MALGDHGAQGRKRRIVAGNESVGGGKRRPVDLRGRPVGAEHEVGVEPDDGIAGAHRPALDRLEKEGGRPVGGHFEIGRHGGLEVADEGCRNDLSLPTLIGFRECRGLRFDLHEWHLPRGYSVAPRPIAWFNAV